MKIRTSKADERRTSNVENEVEGELVRGDDHGETRPEANMNEEDGWALAEEREDIQDDVAFVSGAWKENSAVFEQKTLVGHRVGLGCQRRCVRQRGGEGS